MAKKTKRKVSQVNTPTSASVAVQSPASETTSASRSSFSRRTATTATAPEFNPDYTYVVNDLKRIGMLAGAFFIVLIALSFIIK
jgi:hypothetical protein